MIYSLLVFLICCHIMKNMHFNGGTITWEAIDPFINSSRVTVIITQSYSWTYPAITCAQNVPISTPGRSTQNTNLICISDCSTDGNYSKNPINILTDCQTASSSLGLMTSQRSVRINLTAGAHLYLAHIGAAWAPIDYPSQSGLQWSIVTFIDLRFRSDGFINTPPVASVVSPQYAIVNRTSQINIPVSDVNTGDDVRCRWSVYQTGYRRRRRFDDELDEGTFKYNYGSTIYNSSSNYRNQTRLIRTKRKACNKCDSTCKKDTACCCSVCTGTTCTGAKCTTKTGCPVVTTTPETPGTTKVTSSYPIRQAIDECGGICYPNGVPTGTTLSNCTITFKGLVPDTWYAISIQVIQIISDEYILILFMFSL